MKKRLFGKFIFITFVLISNFVSCSMGNEKDYQNPDNNNYQNDNGKLKFNVGDVVTVGGVPEGIVFHVDENSDGGSGKILSLERYKAMYSEIYTKFNTSSYATTLIANSSETDGQANYDLLCQVIPDFDGNSDYPAWFWCKYTKGNDWYIPAINELKEIASYETKISEIISSLNEDGIKASYFDRNMTWSSTPRGIVDGMSPSRLSLYFAGKQSNPYDKFSAISNDSLYVQPVRTFNLQMKGIGKYERNPKFTDFEIPTVTVTKKGVKATAIVRGKNFKSSDFVKSKLKLSCETSPYTLSNVNYVIGGDIVIFIEFSIPSKSGNYPLTLSYGTTSIKGTLKVKESYNYTVGSVLLNDGSILKYDSSSLSFTDEQKKNAIGVIFEENEFGVPLVLGIHNSAGGNKSGCYAWALSSVDARNTVFAELQCFASGYGKNAANTATFTGDINGFDNWDIIRGIYKNDTDASKPEEPDTTNFPAFYYVISYPKFFNISDNYSKGWYMPSLSELCSIYRNKQIINSVLKALDGVEINNNDYWASSQGESSGAWSVKMSDGSITNIGTQLVDNGYHSMRVCCIRPIE